MHDLKPHFNPTRRMLLTAAGLLYAVVFCLFAFLEQDRALASVMLSISRSCWRQSPAGRFWARSRASSQRFLHGRNRDQPCT